MKKKIVLLIPIIICSLVGNSALVSGSSSLILAHGIIQTSHNIQIYTEDPISYYSGALIGFNHTQVEETKTIFDAKIRGFQVTFGRVKHEDCSHEFVLVASHSDDTGEIFASTILISDSESSYPQAETDIGFFNTTTIEAMNTQEQVHQKFAQSWSEHYRNLKRVVFRLIEAYSTSGNDRLKETAKIYTKFCPLLDILRHIVKTTLRSYDKTIDNPRAIVLNRINPDQPRRLDQKYIEASSQDGAFMVTIEGDAVAWREGPTPNYPYLVTLDGRMGVSTFGTASVTMPHLITGLYYSIYSGVGSVQIPYGGEGSGSVVFYMEGLAAWKLHVSTRFYERSETVRVTVLARTDGIDWDWADLKL
ncbi:MAG: hypothetical protein U9O89_07495 [Thermoproteota archaeon]|nr:hypothetical protein [Thermoproteota archaeon]